MKRKAQEWPADAVPERTLATEINLAHEMTRGIARSIPGAFAAPSFVAARQVLVDRLIAGRSHDNPCRLFATLFYFDRLCIALYDRGRGEQAPAAYGLGRLTHPQLFRFCRYSAEKLARGDTGRSPPLLDLCPDVHPSRLAALEMEMYEALDWKVAHRADAPQILVSLVRFVPLALRADFVRLSWHLVVLSAYDLRLSPAFTSPLSVAMAAFVMALRALDPEARPAGLSEMAPDLRLDPPEIAWCVRRLAHSWECTTSHPQCRRHCTWLRDHMCHMRVPVRVTPENAYDQSMRHLPAKRQCRRPSSPVVACAGGGAPADWDPAATASCHHQHLGPHALGDKDAPLGASGKMVFLQSKRINV